MEEPVNDLLAEAARHQSAGRFDSAVACYQKALEIKPQIVPALLQFGRLRLQQGLHAEAADLINRALEIDPQIPGGCTAMGLALSNLDRLEDAVASFTRAVAQRDDDLQALTSLGILLSVQDRLEEAVPYYQQAIGLAPDDAELHNGVGIALIGLGRPEEAAAALHRAVALAPEVAEPHSNLGMALGQLGRLDDAVASFQRAITLQPDYVDAHLNLAQAVRQAGDLDAAAASYRQLLVLAPDYAPGHFVLGVLLAELRRPADAIVCYERCLDLQPDQPDAHLNLAAALQEVGALDAAIAHCEKVLAARPDSTAAHVNMANALRGQRKFDVAIEQYRRALTIEPDHSVAHLNLGLVLAESGDLDEAIRCYRQALRLRPDFPEAHHALGRALREAGRYDSAIEHLDHALALRPDLAAAYADKGNALKEMGRFDSALQSFGIAIARAPGRAEFYHDLADCKRFTDGDPHLLAMQTLSAQAETLTDDGRVALQFALGKAYADVGDTTRSFAALQDGNALKRRQVAYDEATTLAVLERVRATFTPALLSAHEGAGDPSHMPIFIVGMPRSGSTLVEQILASHPDVHGAGEVNAFHNAVAGLGGTNGTPVAYPEVVSGLNGDQLRQLGADYVVALTTAAEQAPRVTDKMLANFRFLGLIHLALPNARIIHIRRDPVDTCLSCFSKLFAGVIPYAYDLGELGRYYRGYARLMAHWRTVLPQDVMLEVDYENVVADLEGAARRIVAHCGLAWDARCLAFHATERSVRTASAVQVRQPLYRDAVGRSRPYAPMLQPLLGALGATPNVARPNDVAPMFDAALALQRHGRADEAESLYREILQLDPAHVDALHNLGVQRLAAGGAAEAVPLLREALRLRPAFAWGYYSLGLALQADGRKAEASTAFQQAIDHMPDPAAATSLPGTAPADPGQTVRAAEAGDRAIATRSGDATVYNDRANILLAAQRLAEAAAECHKALACQPDFVPAHNNLGLALQMMNRHQEARAAFERVLELDPAHPTAHCGLGMALQSCGQYAQAIAQFEQALVLQPDNADAWSKLGTALSETGRLNDARRAYEQAVAIAPRAPLYHRQLSVSRQYEPDDPHLSALEALAGDLSALGAAGRIDLHFALGKAYADLERQADSFRHLLAGNALTRRQIDYDETATLAVFERIRDLCSPALMRAKAGLGHPSSLPVFVVGMPRSGSTLVEQILASHPRVFGAGELAAFEGALTQASGPGGSPRKFLETLPDAPKEALRNAGATYVAAVAALAPQAARVIDKMPPNFLFVGAIHLALPNARIIHTRRDPVDTCLSCFSKLFAGDIPYAYDLGELGRYYRAYAELMAHWRAVLPPGVMLEVDYEDVVSGLETAARRIVAHCGLDWHPGCLDFHLTDRPVRTASAVAVRQKLYSTAVGRWRPYASLLRPLLDALGAG